MLAWWSSKQQEKQLDGKGALADRLLAGPLALRTVFTGHISLLKPECEG